VLYAAGNSGWAALGLRWAGRLTRWQGRIPLLVGVAGHRQLDAREQEQIERQLRVFFTELRAQLPATPVVLVSRLAGGADQLAASVALAAGCELACLLPLDAAAYRAAFSSESARAAFDRLFAASTVLAPAAGSGSAADPEQAYAQAGYYLTRHATLMLVLWDGESHHRGSVADVVRARAAGRMGELDPTLCTLPVGRRGSGRHGAPALSARAAIEACGWRDADAFNAAVSAHGRPELAGTPAAPFGAVPDERVGDVATVLRAASLRAAEIHRALALRKTLLQIIAFLAAIAFAVFLKFGTQGWILWVYLALLAAALSVRTLVRRQGLHRRYLDCRGLAEGLRVAIYWRVAGVLGDARDESPALHLIGGPDAALGWIGLAIAALDGWMGRTALPDGFDGCEFAARHWLASEAVRDAQIPYYRAAASRLRRIVRWVEGVVSLTLITGVGSAALLAVMPAAWLGRAAPILITIMGFMPLVSGTASAAIDAPAEREVARQYEYTGHLLAQAARRLAAANTDGERRQILFEAGAAALAEQRVWHAVVGQKGPTGRARA
jgi:hypothetical protein